MESASVSPGVAVLGALLKDQRLVTAADASEERKAALASRATTDFMRMTR
jgi:hypothetical protein